MDGDGSLNRKSTRDRLVVTQSEKVHKELFEDFVKLAKSMLTHESRTPNFRCCYGRWRWLRVPLSALLPR